MKNTLKKNKLSFLLGLIVIALLSACGSNSNITKRHYNKGYYVTHKKHNQKPNAVKQEEKIAHAKAIETPSINPTNKNTAVDENPVADNNVSPQEKKENKIKVENPTKDTKNLVASANKKQVIAHKRSLSKDAMKYAAAFKMFKEKQKSGFNFSKKNMLVRSSDDGYSLFWLIILILLILWALGFTLGGYGGLIHLLLVIALILLILWLLRII